METGEPPGGVCDSERRRILVKVRFPEPLRDARREIWAKHLPPTAPAAPDVDLDALSGRFEMAGEGPRARAVRKRCMMGATDVPLVGIRMFGGCEMPDGRRGCACKRRGRLIV